MSAAPATVATLPTTSVRRGESTARWMILGLSSGVILLSMLLTLGSEPDQVMVPLINRPLPPLCTMKRVTGIDCPGCGLTRSFVALGHGQWQDSFRYNPAGPIWFFLIAAQIPYQ